MADNVQLNAGVGGAIAAADEIAAGVLAQRIKLIHGIDGVNDGDVAKTNPLPVANYPTTSGGFSSLSINAAASNNATQVKNAAGQVFGVHVFNNAAYPIYVKLYNKATAPAPNADNALLVRRIGVQSGTARDVLFPAGVPFATGIGLAIVKGIGDTDNTPVVASDCLAELDYA